MILVHNGGFLWLAARMAHVPLMLWHFQDVLLACSLRGRCNSLRSLFKAFLKVKCNAMQCTRATET